MNPAIAELPDLLMDLKYADPEDNTNTGIQRAFKTDLPAFLWLQGDAEKVSYFQTYMATVRFGDKPTFLDKYPVEEKITNLSPDRPLFVDVGGGFGSQAVAFKQKYPNLPGRIIFQDLPQTVEQVATPSGVEGVPYDFFQPQGIKGMFISFVLLFVSCAGLFVCLHAMSTPF
jgi:demethylsterigmatocystin 6-O-methyltransferase